MTGKIDIREQAKRAKEASTALAQATSAEKNTVLDSIANALGEHHDEILHANAQDVTEAKKAGLESFFIERLSLTTARIDSIVQDTRNIIALPDPVGEVFDERTLQNGLQISRRRVPLGLIACIYESRPNVTVDVATLCLKSGNASFLRGGKEAIRSNRAFGNAIHAGIASAETSISPEVVQLITEPDRAHVDQILKMHDLIDLVVPRGGADLIAHVTDTATMAVVAGGIGVVHVYVDATADLEVALEVVDNSKTRRYSICNALDTLLVHQSVATDFCQRLADRWKDRVTVLASEDAYELIQSINEFPGLSIEKAVAEDWDTEHLAMCAGVRIVTDLDAAIEHIAKHGSGHSESILTTSNSSAERFLNEVDAAAVYVNASTQFTDGGQFGLGAELGISTQKIHARGPVGLRELTSYKWVVYGDGQVRPI